MYIIGLQKLGFIAIFFHGCGWRESLRLRESTIAPGEIDEEVEVPQQLLDVLAHNMPRFLQLVNNWSDKSANLDERGLRGSDMLG